jgi:hypothetical protein
MTPLLVALLAALRTTIRCRLELAAEILALRHQLAVLQQTAKKRPCLRPIDRLLWMLLSRVWPNWRRQAVHIVTPATVQEVDALMVADVVQRADVGMAEGRDGLGLAPETLEEIGVVLEVRRKSLDGDGAIQPHVAGFVNLAHAAHANLSGDLVGTEVGASGQSHDKRLQL